MNTIQEIIDKVAFLDGSLRDIYIFNVSLKDWDRLLKVLKELYPLESSEDIIPDSIQEIIPIVEERRFTLNILIGHGISANCHFFISESHPSPIEFDLNPRELQSPYAMERVLHFMRELGKGLNRDVFLTEENSEAAILLSYSPSSTEGFYLPPNSGVQTVTDE